MHPSKLTILAVRAWERQAGLQLIHERPDELNRQVVPSIPRAATGQARLVLEHTLVESLLNQRSTQIAAVAMSEPLERDQVQFRPPRED